MPRLAATVVLRNPQTRDRAVLLAGTIAPDWAVPLISNPEAWEQPAPEPDSAPSESGAATPPPAARPQGNASRQAWLAYAQQVGLTDLDDMTRDEIRALVEQQ